MNALIRIAIEVATPMVAGYLAGEVRKNVAESYAKKMGGGRRAVHLAREHASNANLWGREAYQTPCLMRVADSIGVHVDRRTPMQCDQDLLAAMKRCGLRPVYQSANMPLHCFREKVRTQLKKETVALLHNHAMLLDASGRTWADTRESSEKSNVEKFITFSN